MAYKLTIVLSRTEHDRSGIEAWDVPIRVNGMVDKAELNVAIQAVEAFVKQLRQDT
jgi:hypothetical protein